MYRTSALTGIALLGLTAACAVPDTAAGPPSALHPPQTRRSSFSASSAPLDTLNVTISGIGIVKRPQTMTYRANVSNSTATRFYYNWFETDCLSNCDTSSFWPLAEGEGLSSINSGYASTTDYRNFVVHVTELDGTGRAGAGHFETQGPDLWVTGGGTGFATSPCDFYSDSFYPLTGSYTDPFGVTRDRYFRRNYCTNETSWDPNS
jgi:hypothetical protein